MAYEEISWHYDDRNLSIGLDRAGRGPTVLLLPALSSISTRREMFPLQERLAQSFTTVVIDWPGFGELPKPYVDWRPEIYEAFLTHLLTNVVPDPFGTIAAGHAAGYALKHFARHKHAGRLVLLSPTWRGPLPTMMGGDRVIFSKIARAFDSPLLGAMLYGLNVNRVVIGMMARGHVYADPAWLSGRRMEEKLTVTRSPGARHASARFVTGRLDPFGSREEQAKAVQYVTAPMLNLFSENAPAKSRAEMEALARLPNVRTVRLPRGKLSCHEEFPEEAANVIREFLVAS
jgi:pimeloyl-ACP methyl ester carboxylesterase